MNTLAWISACVLMLLAALHVHWGLGGSFPVRDRANLARTVVGSDPGLPMQGALACLVVAGLLLASALLVLGASHTLSLGFPALLTQAGACVVGGVLVVRGVGGFFETRLRPQILGTPYARLNQVLYSPLSLALGAMVFAATLA